VSSRPRRPPFVYTLLCPNRPILWQVGLKYNCIMEHKEISFKQQDRIAGLLAELELKHGPVEPQIMEEVRKAWPARGGLGSGCRSMAKLKTD
jgi:hypothetical protein